MKRLFLLAFFIVILISANAQDWYTYYRSEEIEINYQRVECHDEVNGIHKSILELQFVNLTSRHLSLSFNKQMWYNGKCIGCNNPSEQYFTITLNPDQILVGACDDKRNKSLYIVEKMLHGNGSVLTRFELANIKVNITR